MPRLVDPQLKEDLETLVSLDKEFAMFMDSEKEAHGPCVSTRENSKNRRDPHCAGTFHCCPRRRVFRVEARRDTSEIDHPGRVSVLAGIPSHFVSFGSISPFINNERLPKSELSSIRVS